MGAELSQSQRIYFSIQDGYFKQRISNTITNQYNKLSRVYLIDVGFRKVEKDMGNGAKEHLGDVLQLHLVDAEEYFVVETWIRSSYAKSFYQVMEKIDFSSEFIMITDQKIKDGKKKLSLFIKQFGQTLKWSYTKDNMGDCPVADYIENPEGGWLVNETAQMQYFLDKVVNWLMPKIKKLPSPYPNHPIYENTNGINNR
jgi:hypothetical protein